MTRQNVRENLALASGGVIAFAYQWFRSSEPVVDRLGAAFGAGLVLYFAGLIGSGIAPLVADYLLGQSVETGTPPKRYMVGGALLVTFMWIWWQVDRASTVDEIASCVERMAQEEPRRPFDGAYAVRACYGERGDQNSDEF